MMRYFVKEGLFESIDGVITCLKIAKRLNKSMTSNPQMRGIIEELKNHDGVMTKSEIVMQDQITLDNNTTDKNKTSPVKPEAKPKKAKFNEFDLENAQWMLLLIKKINPKMKEPKIEAWAKHIRDMREIDDRDINLIQEVFTWANKDSFWKVNILSPKKLRDKFDDLMAKMNNAGSSNQSQQPTDLGSAGGDWHLPENRRIL